MLCKHCEKVEVKGENFVCNDCSKKINTCLSCDEQMIYDKLTYLGQSYVPNYGMEMYYTCDECLTKRYNTMLERNQANDSKPQDKWNAATIAMHKELEDKVKELSKQIQDLSEHVGNLQRYKVGEIELMLQTRILDRIAELEDRALSAEQVQSTHYKWIEEIKVRLENQEKFRDHQVQINRVNRGYNMPVDTGGLSSEAWPPFSKLIKQIQQFQAQIAHLEVCIQEKDSNFNAMYNGFQRQIQAIKDLCKTYGYSLEQDNKGEFYFSPENTEADSYLPTVDGE